MEEMGEKGRKRGIMEEKRGNGRKGEENGGKGRKKEEKR